MKKVLICVWALLLCCAGALPEMKAEEDIPLQNGRVRLTLDAYGQLLGLESLLTGRQYLNGAPCGFKMTVNTSTDDIWASAHGSEVSLSSADAPAIIARDGNVVVIRQAFPLANGTINVERTLTLAADSGLCSFDLSIQNECAGSVVTKIDWLSLKGLTDADNSMQLLWPDKEGEMYPAFFASQKHVSASYPSLMSMQYIALSGDQESLYYGVHDTSRQFKRFDVNAKLGTLKSTLYPFAAAGETVALPRVVWGVTDGDWHGAADVYRHYLIENGFAKPYGAMASAYAGVAACNLCAYPQKYGVKYAANAAKQGGMAAQAKRTLETYGTPLTIFLGWHEKGFDSMYPDYRFIDAYGGEEAFAQGMAQVHAAGGKALLYINLHIADTKSDWYNTPAENGRTNGENCAIRTAYQSVLHEDYGTGLDYVAMCPAAPAWQDAIAAAVARTRENGADGYWFDQLMEMPGNLCYNKEHGHSTPATAYAEGYDALFARINSLTADGDCLYACEGVCDAYLRYIDCCGLMWARLFGYSAQSAPRITRYTLPTLFFGLPTSGATPGSQGQYAHAWVMGDGMLCRDNNPLCKRYAALAARYPEIYATGRYMDTRGVSGVPEGVLAGVLRAREEDGRWAVQLFNQNPERVTFALSVDDAAVYAVYDAESGQALPAVEGGWQVSLSANRAVSVIVECAR